MTHETDHDFHMRRARAEIDLAYRSECRAAMEAHLRLSSLHMQRLKTSQPAVRPPGPATFPVHCGAGLLAPVAGEGMSRRA